MGFSYEHSVRRSSCGRFVCVELWVLLGRTLAESIRTFRLPSLSIKTKVKLLDHTPWDSTNSSSATYVTANITTTSSASFRRVLRKRMVICWVYRSEKNKCLVQKGNKIMVREGFYMVEFF